MVMSAMRELRIRKWDMLDDGDDCLLFIERQDLPALSAGLGEVFLSYGHEVVVEEPSFEMEQIETCKSKPVEVGGIWTMVKDYRAVLSKSFSSYRHYHNAVEGMRFQLTLMHAYALLYRGVPVLGWVYYHCYMHLKGRVKELQLVWNDDLFYTLQREGLNLGRDPTLHTPDARTRESFERAFGLGSVGQLALEKRLVGEIAEQYDRWAAPVMVAGPIVGVKVKTAA
jgi:hypothetical protein